MHIPLTHGKFTPSELKWNMRRNYILADSLVLQMAEHVHCSIRNLMHRYFTLFSDCKYWWYI